MELFTLSQVVNEVTESAKRKREIGRLLFRAALRAESHTSDSASLLVVEGRNTRQLLALKELQGGTTASAAVRDLRGRLLRWQPDSRRPEKAALSSVPYFLQAVAVSPPVSLACAEEKRQTDSQDQNQNCMHNIRDDSLERLFQRTHRPPITVMVPAPVASTTASISFFLGVNSEEDCHAEASLARQCQTAGDLSVSNKSRSARCLAGVLRASLELGHLEHSHGSLQPRRMTYLCLNFPTPAVWD